MKKILIILITIPLIFGSCEKEDESPNSNSNSNNPTGNTFNGTTGYLLDEGYDRIFKTTDSGNSWILVTDINDFSPFGTGKISFVN
jgi:hypothetical protein